MEDDYNQSELDRQPQQEPEANKFIESDRRDSPSQKKLPSKYSLPTFTEKTNKDGESFHSDLKLNHFKSYDPNHRSISILSVSTDNNNTNGSKANQDKRYSTEIFDVSATKGNIKKMDEVELIKHNSGKTNITIAPMSDLES